MEMNSFKQKYFDIVFLIEHKDRELETVKEIAGCLKKEFGLSSLVISAYFHTQSLVCLCTKMLVMPYIFSEDLELVKSARRVFADNVLYVNMNWEQVLSEGMKESKAPRDDFVKNRVIHLAWDQSFRSYLASHGVLQRNVHVTGRPYSMVLENMQERRAELRSQFAAKFGFDEKKEWFFFPDNLGWKFQSDKAIRARIRGGWAADKAYEYRRFSAQCFVEFARFIKRLDERKLAPIIIRPHPSITVQEYAEAFRDCGILLSERVKFLKNGTANEWVTASDVIGSSWSTVVLDAFHLGKKCFLFQPFDLPRWLSVPWHDQIRRIRGFEEFEEFLRRGDATPMAHARVGDDPVRQTASIMEEMCREVTPASAKWTVSKDFLVPAAKGLLFRLTPFRTNSRKYLLDYFTPWTS